jgi:hypothetical protein
MEGFEKGRFFLKQRSLKSDMGRESVSDREFGLDFAVMGSFCEKKGNFQLQL